MTRTVYERFGSECGEGWRSLIEPLLEECKEKHVQVAQVKEKFGTLRFYVYGADPDLQHRIAVAEEKSAHICELCGEEGALKNIGSWLKTLCPTHFAERETQRLKDKLDAEESHKRWKEKHGIH